jgi:hypothetical protein
VRHWGSSVEGGGFSCAQPCVLLMLCCPPNVSPCLPLMLPPGPLHPFIKSFGGKVHGGWLRSIKQTWPQVEQVRCC